MNSRPDPQWDQVAIALRRAGVAQRPEGEDLSAPHGFATGVVARTRADSRADATGLSLWRRWAIGGACAALAVFGASCLIPAPKPAPAQFVPVPAFETIELPNLTNE